jgi:hypothetical protein
MDETVKARIADIHSGDRAAQGQAFQFLMEAFCLTCRSARFHVCRPRGRSPRRRRWDLGRAP